MSTLLLTFEDIGVKEIDDLALLILEYLRYEEDVMVTDYEVQP